MSSNHHSNCNCCAWQRCQSGMDQRTGWCRCGDINKCFGSLEWISLVTTCSSGKQIIHTHFRTILPILIERIVGTGFLEGWRVFQLLYFCMESTVKLWKPQQSKYCLWQCKNMIMMKPTLATHHPNAADIYMRGFSMTKKGSFSSAGPHSLALISLHFIRHCGEPQKKPVCFGVVLCLGIHAAKPHTGLTRPLPPPPPSLPLQLPSNASV